MDGRPIRQQRGTVERHGNVAQAERTARSAEVAAAPTRSTPPEAPRTRGHRNETPSPSPLKKMLLPLVGLLIVAALVVGGWFAWNGMNGSSTGVAIDSSKYQAVFFTNGQVYFGKLQQLNDETLKLTDIFYLQTQSAEGEDSNNPQQATEDQAGVQLIKLGQEVHGPEDEMIIIKDQVLFYENLKTDGKVAKSIEEYKKK